MNQYKESMENLDGKEDLKFLGKFLIRNLSLSSKVSFYGHFACSTISRDLKIQKMNQYEERIENLHAKGDLKFLG
jgi:hypothetical protein